MYFSIIDPTQVDQQGPDIGPQYRTGIYYTDESEKEIIANALKELKKQYPGELIVVENLPLLNFYSAEDYHQEYLYKNPGGYCHIPYRKMRMAHHIYPVLDFYMTLERPDDEHIENMLSELSYSVTQNCATEPPFNNEYYMNNEKGIYVDIITGEPLFSSEDKFTSSCGWPSFYKPIDKRCILFKEDNSFGMTRTEVIGRSSKAHLGHVFKDVYDKEDNITERYCINSAALKFIPYEKFDENGLAELKPYF